MRITLPFSLALAVSALILTGCDSTPTEPRFNAPPNPTPPSGSWTVTLTVTQAVGSFCISLPAAGTTATTLYTIQGEGMPTETFSGPDSEWNSYTVAVDGLSFQSAPVTLSQSAGCAAYVFTTRFAGTFTSDRKGFTATQWDTFTLGTGDVVSRTWSWSGKRN